MQYEIKYKPSYSMVVIKLAQGEGVVGESGAMTYMSPNIQVKTRAREGVLGSLGLKFLGGQSFWVNDFVAEGGPGEIGFVAAPVGDIECLQLKPESGYILRRESYVASTQGINLDVKWEGFTKGLFGQGLFMMRTSGDGNLFINTFGAIDRHTLSPNDAIVVDNFHIVAFSNTCRYQVEKVGGWKETVLSGEGLVTRIFGPGEVLLQTKNPNEFAKWLYTLMEPMIRSRAR